MCGAGGLLPAEPPCGWLLRQVSGFLDVPDEVSVSETT